MRANLWAQRQVSDDGQSSERRTRKSDAEMREWVRANKVAEQASILREMRDRVAKVVSISGDGSAGPRLGLSLPARQMVLCSYVGKQYAAAAGLATDATVENRELVDGLGLPKGTVGRCVKELRDVRLIQVMEEGRHVLPISNIERALKEIELGIQ